jgi:hypothetical protein
MEIMLRCAVPDRPGALAELAGVIGAVGADIQAVDVVDHVDGVALDDLVVVVTDPHRLRALLDRVGELPDITVVHAAPSRGHPGDSVTRFAVGLEAVLSGAMEPVEGVRTLAGGLLRATTADVVDPSEAPTEADGVLTVPFTDRCLVLRRDYPFTDTERARATALARVCAEAAAR